MTGIEEDDTIPAWIVIFLITGQEYVCPHVREHLAYTMNEHVWLVITVVGGHMLLNLVAYKMDEIV